MAYEKKLCILKQIGKGFTADGMPLMGAVYAERLGKELTLTPRIAGLAPLREGRYALAAVVGDKEYCLELRGNTALRVPDCPSLEGGFAVLLCFVRESPEPVAFGTCGTAPDDYHALLDVFYAEGRRSHARERAAARAPIAKEKIPPIPMPPTGVPGVPAPNTPFAPGVPLPGPIPDDEPSPEEDKMPEEAAPREKYDDEALAGGNYFSEPAEQVPQEPAPPSGHTYFESIRPRMEEAFEKGARDDRLCRAVPHSEWVRYEGALLGIVYHLGEPRYVCLAVEAQGDPPEELRDTAVFVPSSPYSDDEGFYVVFQDADSGDIVK